MEQVIQNTMELDSTIQNQISGLTTNITGSEIRSSISIDSSNDEIMITDDLPGVFCQGIQYYDLKAISFISYNGMANLIDFIKSLLRKGIKIQFVNVNDKVKSKIKSIGLEHILNCV